MEGSRWFLGKRMVGVRSWRVRGFKETESKGGRGRQGIVDFVELQTETGFGLASACKGDGLWWVVDLEGGDVVVWERVSSGA
jgi:hypothetical protein